MLMVSSSTKKSKRRSAPTPFDTKKTYVWCYYKKIIALKLVRPPVMLKFPRPDPNDGGAAIPEMVLAQSQTTMMFSLLKSLFLAALRSWSGQDQNAPSKGTFGAQF